MAQSLASRRCSSVKKTDLTRTSFLLGYLFFLLLANPRWCRLSCPCRGSFPPRWGQTRAFEVTDAAAGLFSSSPLVDPQCWHTREIGLLDFLLTAGGST